MALNDEDAVSEVRQAAGDIAGTPVDLDAAEPAVDAALTDLDVDASPRTSQPGTSTL